MPRRLKAIPNSIEGAAARKLNDEAPMLEQAPAPAARRKRAKDARVKTEEARAEEQAETGAALERIQEQLKTTESAADNVIDLAEFRKKKTGAEARAVSLTELEEPFAPEHLAKEEQVPRPAKERAVETPKTDAELHRHLAQAEAARVRAYFVRRAMEKGELTDENGWEYMHQLRSKELELEEALEESFRRPADELELPLFKDERKALVDALLEVQNALDALRSKIEERHAQTQYEENYAEARQKAFDPYKPDLERSRDIREDLARAKLPKEQRGRYLDLFQSRVQALEGKLELLDKLPAEEASKFENAAAYEAVSETVKDLRGTIQDLLQAEQEERGKMEASFPSKSPEELEREIETSTAREAAPHEASRGERLKTYYSSVDKILVNLYEVMRLDRMTEEWRDQALLELSKAYAGLEDELHYFQTQAPNVKTARDARARIADYLQRIDDVRGRLHALRLGESPGITPESKGRGALGKELKAKERELKNLESEATTLVKRVKKLYGRAPEDIVAQGGLGLGGFFTRLASRLSGEDAYGEWKAKMNRIEELSRELGPALAGRPMGSEESLAKLRATPELRELERERIGQRAAARGYREMPRTEEEFFDGTFEEPGEALPAEEQRRIAESLDESGRRGVKNASLMYRNIAENPAAELLSFGPEEYVRQLALVQEAREAQGKTKGQARFAAKKRLKAALSVLTEMQNELRENGINVETGMDQRQR